METIAAVKLPVKRAELAGGSIPPCLLPPGTINPISAFRQALTQKPILKLKALPLVWFVSFLALSASVTAAFYPRVASLQPGETVVALSIVCTL